MTEQDDLAIVVIQLEQGRMEPALEFAAKRLGRGCQRRVAQLLGQYQRGAILGEPAGRRDRPATARDSPFACRPGDAAGARR